MVPDPARPPRPTAVPVLVSCEHAGNEVPASFAQAFRVPADVLGSHRGWDPGSEELGRDLAVALGAPLFVHRVTRLLVDANRSSTNPRRFSEFARALPSELRTRADEEVWAPHRAAVTKALEERIAQDGRVLHLAAHSFTPVLDGIERNVDVGVLYDPSRDGELRFADVFVAGLRSARPDLRVRRNDPYRGTADGFATVLRRRFPDAVYAGLELEVGQAFSVPGGKVWDRLRADVVEASVAAARSW